MRFCRGLALVLTVVWAVGCASAPPTSSTPPLPPPEAAPPVQAPAASVIETETADYKTKSDAPKILAALDQRLATGELVVETLTTSDLRVYANLLLTGSRWGEAEQAMKVLETRTPDDPEVQWALVLLTGARGDVASQERRLSTFEASFPGNTEATALRARLQWAKGDKVGAKQAWASVAAEEENLEALSGLTKLALEAKKPQEAKLYADRAVRAFAADDQAWSLHAEVMVALAKYQEARKDLDRAVALAPDDPWHRLDRGKLAFLHLYDFNSAQADLEFTTLTLPDNFFGWEALAEVYEEQDQSRRAYDAWMRALSLRPDYRFGYPSAAMLSFRYQQWEQAAYYAREAAKAYPAEYAFPFVEALSLRALGKLPASQTVLERARPRFVRGSTVDEMFRFLLTPGSDYYFNAAMNLEKQENVRLRLRFYQGCYYALTKSPSSAKAALQEVSESSLKKIPEITAARDWLENGL